MKVGDLVRVAMCHDHPKLVQELALDAEGNRNIPCSCIFCVNDSNRIGLVSESWIDEDDATSIIAEFDFGEQTFWSSTSGKNNTGRLEVIGTL